MAPAGKGSISSRPLVRTLTRLQKSSKVFCGRSWAFHRVWAFHLMGACWAHAGAARATATIRAMAVTMMRFPDNLFVLIELPSSVCGWLVSDATPA